MPNILLISLLFFSSFFFIFSCGDNKKEVEKCSELNLTGACSDNKTCIDGVCEDKKVVCVSNCLDKVCGDDGCGESCGTCSETETCTELGVCKEASCIPDCSNRTCGDDACGESCGTCPENEICTELGVCKEASCIPDCSNKTCGDDACGNSCGVCDLKEVCSDLGTCEEIIDGQLGGGCENQADCVDNSLCAGGTVSTCNELCTDFRASCSLNDYACYKTVSDTKTWTCAIEGRAKLGEACSKANDCMAGLACLNNVCHEHCNAVTDTCSQDRYRCKFVGVAYFCLGGK